jgi:hypothetical protein
MDDLRKKQLVALLSIKTFERCNPFYAFGHIYCSECYIRKQCQPAYDGTAFGSQKKYFIKEALKDFNNAEILTVLLEYGDKFNDN